ncbi:MAG: DinB family protein [Thermomicrobiales bacterium]
MELEMTRAILATTPQRWTSLIETVPEGLLQRPSTSGEWSAVDCLLHLLTVERDLFSVRLRHILEGRSELVPFADDAFANPRSDRSSKELLAEFVKLRGENGAVLAGFKPEDLDRSSVHPQYGVEITLDNLLNLWAAHDLQHTMQAEEALMQAFIPGTSVWRPEFAAHDVEARS